MASLTPEQRSVLSTIVRVGKEMGASPKVIKAAVETGLVESNLQNLNRGDRDSLGVFQQRPSQGWGSPDQVTNVGHAARSFYSRAIPLRGQYGSAGELAQAVQRSAFPARYNQRGGEAASLLGGLGQDAGALAQSHRTVTTQPGVDNSDARRQALANFLLADSTPDPTTGQPANDILSFALQMRSLKDQPAQTATVTSPSSSPTGGSDLASTAAARANVLDRKHLPYLWGGGHQGRVLNVKDAKPLDCSGAVSAVLGINPRVASQFKTWGKPGDGGNRGVTIAAKDTHVLMKIRGHWFGTSASNPGGGAGWIPQSQISPDYLRGFTLRHSDR